jgi:hypothetical protein
MGYFCGGIKTRKTSLGTWAKKAISAPNAARFEAQFKQLKQF